MYSIPPVADFPTGSTSQYLTFSTLLNHQLLISMPLGVSVITPRGFIASVPGNAVVVVLFIEGYVGVDD